MGGGAMSITEYNGGSIVAMCGDGCVAIASDRRLGIRQLQTVSTNWQKIFPMNDKCYVGLAGLATDVQTVSQLLKLRQNLYALREERQMEPQTLKNMIAHSLYEKRFGPFLISPVVAGLDSEDKPLIASFDMIGAAETSESFVAAGTADDQLLGICESFWRPGLGPEELFEVISQCLLSACDRDWLSGWGAVVHVITPTQVITRTLKGRMD